MNSVANQHQVMSMTQESMIHSDAASWPLARGEARRLGIGPGARMLRVTEGQVWLTAAGNDDELSEDRWLHAGEQVWLDHGSEVVVEAWGEARFQLLVPPQACAAQAALWERAASGLSRLTTALASTRWPAKATAGHAGA